MDLRAYQVMTCIVEMRYLQQAGRIQMTWVGRVWQWVCTYLHVDWEIHTTSYLHVVVALESWVYVHTVGTRVYSRSAAIDGTKGFFPFGFITTCIYYYCVTLYCCLSMRVCYRQGWLYVLHIYSMKFATEYMYSVFIVPGFTGYSRYTCRYGCTLLLQLEMVEMMLGFDV